MAALTGRSLSAVYKWHEKRSLPPADGPLINGYETWRRDTFLAWAENNGFAQDAEGFSLPIRAEARRAFDSVPRERIVRASLTDR